ncbi:MAG: Stf0 family sulfotransferase, partial [Cyanobacteria bacterium J06600_6]
LVGDAASLGYIKKFLSQFQTSVNNYYYDLAAQTLADLNSFAELNLYQALVVVSLEDEAALQSAIKKQLNGSAHPPILRLFGDIFVNKLCDRQLLQRSSKNPQKPAISYAILTPPRSGSTYLCDLLDSTTIAGHPSEHIRLATQELALYCDFDYLNLLGNLMEHRTTSNDVFGTKLISHFLFELKQAKPNFQSVFKAIDHFILLIRQDKVAQAVSLVLAQTTEVWHIHNNDKKASYQSVLENLEINDKLLDDVEQKVVFIKQQEKRLKKVLANHNIEPLLVVYEDILEDAPKEVNRILNFLGIVKPPGYTMQITSGIKRMPSAISQQIIQQYQHRKSVVH